MRVVFAGTPTFACTILEAILAAGDEVPLVLTQPDRRAGRGLKLTPSPVKQMAMAKGLPVAQPQRLRSDGPYAEEAQHTRALLQVAQPDVMVVAAYGLILPQWVLDLPVHGCLNVHASLLPRWRGAAPIQRAIEAGDTHTGITIMQMDAGLDSGDSLLMREIPIGQDQTAGELYTDLADLGASALVQVLQTLKTLGHEALVRVPQPATGITYAAKIDKAEAVLDLSASAEDLARRVRAFNPAPGATLCLPEWGGAVKVWRAQASHENAGAVPGTVLQATSTHIDIATGQGVLRLLELQKPGGKRQSVEQFVQSGGKIDLGGAKKTRDNKTSG